MESALRKFLEGAERCRNAGPLETLLTAAPLHLGMVDACLRVGKALAPLQRPELPTVVVAQAKLVGAELATTTPSFASLRRLAAALSELQEEAERARLDAGDSGAFTALVARLTVRCARPQLAADAAFLAQQQQEAAAEGRHVEAHFMQLAGAVVQALLPPLPPPSPAAGLGAGAVAGAASPAVRNAAHERAAAAGTPSSAHRRSSAAAAGDRSERASAAAMPTASLRRRRLQLAGDESGQVEPGASLEQGGGGGDVGALADRLCSNSTSHAERVAALEALREALSGPQRKEATQALERAGMGQLLRLVVSGNRFVRAATLRLLSELLLADDDGRAQQQQLVAARGLSVLVHQVVTSLEEGGLQRSAVAAALAGGGEAGVVAQHVAVVAAASPAGKGMGGGTPKKGHGYGLADAASPRPEPASPGPMVPGQPAPAREELGVSEEELCVLAIAVLRHMLCGPHMTELMSAGVVKALCRCAALPGGGRVANTAVAALADAAQDGSAAVQMVQERLLVTLADLALSPRASEAGLAFACFAALMQHPARLAAGGTAVCSYGGGSGGSSASSVNGDGAGAGGSSLQQLCVEMGRACDAASTTVLLDVVAGDVGGNADAGDWRSLMPAAVHLLPACLHSPENRAAALRQGAALRRLLRPLAAGDAGAAAVLRRLGSSLDQTKPAVVRLLAQALVESSSSTSASGGRGGACAQQSAQLALALADVLRPVGSRDRAALRWAGEACSEAEGCGVACLHALAVYGSASTRAALGGAGGVPALVDAVKLEAKPLPEPALVPPICSPHTVGHAASEALAALAGSDRMRRDICVQLCAFAGSSSLGLAAAAVGALLQLLAEVPAAGPILAEVGVMQPLVEQLARSPDASSSGCSAVGGGGGGGIRGGRDPYRMSVALQGGAAGGVGGASSHSSSGHGAKSSAEDVLELVQQRAVRLLWALCRGGGSAVDAAVAARAALPLLQRVGSPALDVTLRVEAAAALGPLVRKSGGIRDEVVANGGLAQLLELARSAPTALPLWEDACAALAALVAMHGPTRAEATRVLRQMLVRGPTRSEVAAAAVVVARMATSAAGREVALAEDVVEPLVRLLGLGDDRTKAAAADAIYHLAVAGTLQLPPCTALPHGGAVKPRVALIRAGAVPALLALLDAPNEPGTATGAASSGPTATAAIADAGGMLSVAVLLPVAEALECLAGSEEGVQAIKSAGGVQVLKDTVARGKRRLVPPEVAKAASDALLQCM
ncbi:hypothetical protein HYH02_012882 [Chlamydomonas schloesseri]|uniref:Uncharacterized protein n=1 Tax=Chlamydomonas schloesseri TaxID=2026947 RepID=A0A835W0K0_9CHLO|nr:hypothetical protein HYH02_012882 [Chlamydomonas schloesseri]|eukprot:KAG2432748.1 hypothetical protein HYH02_012882 [Chlamydomonas schloesseri]